MTIRKIPVCLNGEMESEWTLFETNRNEAETAKPKKIVKKKSQERKKNDRERRLINIDHLCRAIRSNGEEPEHGTNLPISSVGTVNNVSHNENLLPVGSALETKA